MVGPLILRGLLAGLLAGVVAFVFAYTVAEPQIDRAVAFESAHAHHQEAAPAARSSPDAAPGGAPGGAHDVAGHEEGAGGELFSRRVQGGIGLVTGLVVYGAALGGLFALAYAACVGRTPLGPRGLAALLAVAGFVVFTLAPALKYPANPPAVGSPDTIRLRTALFFIDLAASLGLALAASALARRLVHRFGAWDAALAGVALFIAGTALVHALLPDINEVPTDFPAVVLWRFRLASLGTHVVLWGGVGLLFGRWMAARRA